MKSDASNLSILDSEVLNLDGLTLKDLEVFESDSGGVDPFLSLQPITVRRRRQNFTAKNVSALVEPGSNTPNPELPPLNPETPIVF